MFEISAKSLRELGYTVSVFETAKEAAEYMNGQIDGETVGMGGSVTIDQMGLYDALASHNTVYWHQVVSAEEKDGIRTKANGADIYISSVNGIAESGEIINIDGACNRVSAILYGHKKVYLVAGKNKIAKDYDAALWRARNIAAPLNAKRLNRKTPCAVKGDRCYDCKSEDRICCGLSVLWRKPLRADFEVILIGEELGY